MFIGLTILINVDKLFFSLCICLGRYELLHDHRLHIDGLHALGRVLISH